MPVVLQIALLKDVQECCRHAFCILLCIHLPDQGVLKFALLKKDHLILVKVRLHLHASKDTGLGNIIVGDSKLSKHQVKVNNGASGQSQ